MLSTTALLMGRMRQDLKYFHISESDWYVVAQENDQWSLYGCFVTSVIILGDLRVWLGTN